MELGRVAFSTPFAEHRRERAQSGTPWGELVDKRNELRRLRTALKAAGLGLWDWDLRTNAVQYSSEWKSQLGYEPHELRDDFAEWESRVHPDDRVRVEETTAKFIADPWPNYANEFRMRHRDGSYRVVLAQAILIHDDNGRPTHMVGTHIDITAQRGAERKLAEREAVLALCIKHSPMPLAMFDSQMRYLATSEAWSQAYRVTHNLIGRSHYEVFPDIPAHWRETHRRVLAGATEQSEREAFHRTDGSVDWVRWQARPWYAASGDVGGLVLFSELVNDRVAAEAKERENEARLRQAMDATRRSEKLLHSVIDAVPHWIMLIDAEGNAKYSNQYGRDHIGSDEATKSELARTALVHPDDLAEALEQRDHMRQPGGRIEASELRLRCKDGAYRWFTVRATPISDGSPDREIVLTLTDDHARKSLQERLLSAQKMEAVGQLAGGIAHDFNNMLMVIQSQAASIAEYPALPSALRHDLADLQLAAERAAALTQQLLAFARRSTMAPVALELNNFLETNINLIRRSLGGMVSVELRSSPIELGVTADPTMLTQVILNLAVNARDAMPNGGTLSLRAYKIELDEQAVRDLPDATVGTWACITARDNGTGMPREVMRRIFEPFFTTKEIGRGTGLGLAMVQGIVQQHRGFVTVSSQPGEGSEFRVHLPLRENVKPAAISSDASAPPLGGGETILVVDDESSVRALIERILQRQGYKVIMAEDARSACKLFAEHGSEIRMVLSDVMMPEGISGVELAKLLREQSPELPILLSSGQSKDIITRGGAWPADLEFLQKPYRPSALLHLVHRLIMASS